MQIDNFQQIDNKSNVFPYYLIIVVFHNVYSYFTVNVHDTSVLYRTKNSAHSIRSSRTVNTCIFIQGK